MDKLCGLEAGPKEKRKKERGNIFPFLSFFILKYLLSIFLTNFKYVLSLYFWSQYFEAVKGFHTFCIEILKQITTLHFLFVIHQERYNTCLCLSKIKVQLHSSFILPKHFQFLTSLIIYSSQTL